ncbi:putative C-type lectin domain family 20 member A isoform X1, partial [Clarias magur]
VLSLVLSVPYRIHLIQQGKTWKDAHAYCRANHIDLATINSSVNMVELQNEAQKQNFSASAWIGLDTNINSWHWSFRNEMLGSFISWSTSQPDNWSGDERCVFTKNGEWSDAPCDTLLFFVCYD